MPNIAKALRDEILRVSAKTSREFATKLRADNAALKKTVADLKRRVVQLERGGRKQPVAAPAETVLDDVVRASISARFTPNTVKRLRARLGVSQGELAQLLDVSAQSVYLWENKEGKLQLRESTKRALVGLRKLGKKQARERLAA